MTPPDWSEVALGDVADVRWGNTSTTKQAYVDSGYRAYSASGPDGFVDWAEHHEPGIVLSAIGAQCGKTWWAEGSWTCIKNTIWFRSRSSDVESRFLFYATADPGIWPKRGAAQPFISQGDARALTLRIPSLSVQRAVVTALSAVDDLIENNRRRIGILEATARLIYREWFLHFRFSGHEDVALVDSKLGPIPQGWSPTSLADHAAVRRESVTPAAFADEEFDHYSIPAFDEARLPAIEPGEDIKSAKYLVRHRSVLLSKLNPRFARVWRVDPSKSARRSICSTEFILLESADWPLSLVSSVVSDTDFGARLAALAGGTSTSHQRAKPSDVMALPILGPPSAIVEQFDQLVSPMLDLVDNLVRQLAVLIQARDLLLPRLVSGELDVVHLDSSPEPVA